MAEEIKYYDISTDSMIVLTQEKFDEIQKFMGKITTTNMKIEDNRQGNLQRFGFKLAVYPNRMRDDGVFVAEDRFIEPYEHIRDAEGKPCYPSVPQQGYRIPGQLPRAFAHELVRRWNKGGEK